MIFMICKGICDSKIKNYCPRVSSPANTSGTIPQNGKREIYLSSPPSTVICLLSDLSSEIRKSRGACFENSKPKKKKKKSQGKELFSTTPKYS